VLCVYIAQGGIGAAVTGLRAECIAVLAELEVNPPVPSRTTHIERRADPRECGSTLVFPSPSHLAFPVVRPDWTLRTKRSRRWRRRSSRRGSRGYSRMLRRQQRRRALVNLCRTACRCGVTPWKFERLRATSITHPHLAILLPYPYTPAGNTLDAAKVAGVMVVKADGLVGWRRLRWWGDPTWESRAC
jgi:hypothetical protein